MSSEPLFTIAVPTLNRADLLKEAIGGVMAQSCGDFELLISDNASTDRTRGVMESLAGGRIRCLYQNENLGPIGNFDALLAAARGRYFVLHQDDDLLAVDFLERARAALAAEAGIVLYGAPRWRGNAGWGFGGALPPMEPGRIASGRPAVFPGSDFAVMLLHQQPLLSPAVVFERDALRRIGGFRTGNLYGSDIVTQARISRLGSVAISPVIGCVMRDHPASYSWTISDRERVSSLRWMYDTLIEHLDRHVTDWQRRLAGQIEGYESSRCLELLARWSGQSTQKRLQRLAWRQLRRCWPHSTRSLLCECRRRIGWRSTMRWWMGGE